MAGDWRKTSIGDVSEVIGGGTPSSKIPEYWGDEVPWITPKDLSTHPYRYISKGERSISKLGLQKSSARLLPEKTVLVTSRAPIGYVAIAKNKVSTNQGFKSLILEENQSPDFFYYLIKQIVPQLEAHSSGSTFKEISGSVMKQIEIIVPPLPEQKAIAHVLGSLDDKIELNRRMNETLEGMAQALFKSWFVDFDPVIDNALAAGNPIPEPLAQRAETRRQAIANGTANRESAQAFPASFRFTEELGWIPEAWETQALYDVANFVNGAAYKSKDFSESPDAIPVIKIAEVKNGITGQTKFTEVDKGEKYKIVNGDILLSWSGNPDTSIDTFIWSNGIGYLNQHIFNVQLKQTEEKFYVYNLLKYLRPVFAEIARDKQTTGLGHFTAGDMKRLMVFKPEEVILEEFNRIASPVYLRAFESRLESQNLAQLRDVLLPKLISGELRIPQAEKMVEEAIG